jgi:hypothetical protein
VKTNLALNRVFRECGGGYWVVDVSKGEGYERVRTKRRSGAAATAAAASNTTEASGANTEYQFVHTEFHDDAIDDDDDDDDSDADM